MRAKEGGMTLLEVLLTMMVLALGMFAAAALQVRGMQAVERAQRDGQALQLAQGMLERVRASGTLDAGEESAWRVRVTEALGTSAQGRIRRHADMLALEVHWPALPGGRPALQLQGRVLP
ncbi:type IV pilus modification protein PilV [Pseudomonas maumuensis]|uniref:Type IV pilus modification protein PilV n=1 Tax=Pseudomonas maumuensis TaxID=2842354 RepID=A0ABX8NII0_9PSED|nr:type IV pilus modification protein PilV [Pseudomonas maumuensis]QXH55973.1 type IV pilus modification protein PilV [Pseudomonas maumuensis]